MKSIGICFTVVRSIPDGVFFRDDEYDDLHTRERLIEVINDIPAKELHELFKIEEVERDIDMNLQTVMFSTAIGYEI